MGRDKNEGYDGLFTLTLFLCLNARKPYIQNFFWIQFNFGRFKLQSNSLQIPDWRNGARFRYQLIYKISKIDWRITQKLTVYFFIKGFNHTFRKIKFNQPCDRHTEGCQQIKPCTRGSRLSNLLLQFSRLTYLHTSLVDWPFMQLITCNQMCQ